MVEYQVKIGNTTFGELNNITGFTTINPFGDRFVAELIDSEGGKAEEITTDQPAEIFAREPTPSTDADNSFSSIFEGYIVQSEGVEIDNRDVLEATIYSFDQIIRNERVSNDQSGKTISTALEDIIKTDTPVAYVGGNVSVGDDREINRPLQGQTVEDALRILSQRSENETYGVNDNREFFFQRREETGGNEDVVDADVLSYDIPERGKESKNQVTVWYNNDNESVEVSLGSNQLEVQDSLNTQDPVPFPDEISRPTITNRQEALGEGRNFLRQREDTLSGQVVVVGTFELLQNDVGDSINITITPRGIDDEFVIVGKEVDYLRNTIAFDIVEKRGDQDSLLKEIGNQLKTEELSGADRGSKPDKVTQTEIRADISLSLSGVDAQIKRVTTTCRNKLRSAWVGDDLLTIDSVELGDGTTVRRSDTSVLSTVDTQSVSGSANGSDGFDVSFSLTGTGNILGFFDADGNLLFTILIDSTTDPSGTLTVTIDDNSPENGVLTSTGQEAIRDLFVGNQNLLPDSVEYGDNGADVSESDTSISTQFNRLYQDNTIRTIDTQTKWENNTTIADDNPVYIENGKLKRAQSSFVDDQSGAASDVRYSGGEATQIVSQNQDIFFNFTTKYDIENPKLYIRSEEQQLGDFTNLVVFLDGANQGQRGSPNTLGWVSENIDSISAGSHSIKLEPPQLSGFNYGVVDLDVVAVVDGQFNYSFDNTVNVDNGYLDGPEPHPTVASQSITTIQPVQQITQAEINASYNNTLNGQFVEVESGSTTTRANNSETATQSFSQPVNEIDATVGVDGFGTRDTATPRTRFQTQTVDLVDLLADLAVLNPSDVGRADYEVIFSGTEANGTTLREAGQVNSNGDALTRSIFPELNPTGEAVILSEDLGFDISD